MVPRAVLINGFFSLFESPFFSAHKLKFLSSLSTQKTHKTPLRRAHYLDEHHEGDASTHFSLIEIPNSSHHHYPSSSSLSTHKTLKKPKNRDCSEDPLLKSHHLSSDVASICSLLIQPISEPIQFQEILKPYQNKLDSNVVLGILKNYKFLGRKNTLGFFSWAGFQLGFKFDDTVIEYMADYLCRRKLFDDLRCLLKTVLSVKGSVNARTLSICIRFLGRDGRVDEALSLFQEMESLFNCSPDNLVFNNMLYVLCKKAASDDQSLNLGSIDSAFSIFKRMECPDTYSYSNLLIGFCQFGKIDRALDVFNEMVKVGMTPTRSAINNLIGGLCDENSERLRCEKLRINDHRRPFSIMVPNIAKRSYIEPAIEVFKKVCELGLFPSAFVLNMLVFELCRVRELDEALDIVRIAETRDKAHVLDMYTIVIRALCKVRRVDEARESFDRVILLGLQPKLALYSSLICALCKIGSLVEAERVFDAMRKNKCDPDSVTYTVMIHGYCRVEKWEAAYGLLLEMFGMGWSPHFHTYSWVDDIVRKNGRDDLALKLERKLEIQVLQSHCKAGRLEAAHKKLGSMIERGVYPPIYTRDLFERAFQKAGKYHVAREILEKIQR